MFSIIIPTYNRPQELKVCLQSLNELCATHIEFEVIVIDDCSTIHYEPNFSECQFNYQYIRLPVNQGPSGARNSGVLRAKYEWLMFLDDDDRFESNKLSVAAEMIENNKDCEFFYHPAFIHMVNENFTYQTKPKSYHSFGDMRHVIYNENPVGGAPNIIISKSLFLRAGMLDSSMKAIEDYELIIRLVSKFPEQKSKYINIPLSRCSYVTQKSSVSKSYINTKDSCDYIREKYSLSEFDNKVFIKNENLMCAYSLIMNKDRRAAQFYLRAFMCSRNTGFLAAAVMSVLYPEAIFTVKKIISKLTERIGDR